MSGPGHERYAVSWKSMWTSSLLTQGAAGEISARTSLAMFTLTSGCSVSSIEGEPGKEVEGLASLGEQKRDDHKCCARAATGEQRGLSSAASNTRTRRSG